MKRVKPISQSESCGMNISPVVIAALFVVIIFPVWVAGIVYFHNRESK